MSEFANMNIPMDNNYISTASAAVQKIKVVLHVHTLFSPCAETSVEDIINYCKNKSIQAIGITDHDTINGGLALSAIANGLKVIIGSEIRTAQGEIVGLFLKNEISSGLDALKTCELIKEQGGLVYIPHPFDPFKIRRLKLKSIIKCLDLIDIIEVFNAKTTIPFFNRIADQFAKKYNKVAAVGSDSHFLESIDNCINVMEDFDSPIQFLNNLKNAEFIKKRNGAVRGWWIGIKNVLITEGHKINRYGRKTIGKP